MGMKEPRLIDVIRAFHAEDQQAEKAQYGPRRAVLLCHSGQQRYDVGEVRGHVVIGTTWRHDLRYANYDVYVSCRKCSGRTGLWRLHFAKIREALRAREGGPCGSDRGAGRPWTTDLHRRGYQRGAPHRAKCLALSQGGGAPAGRPRAGA